MAEAEKNIITLKLDIDDISKQIQPVIDQLEQHYRDFLQQHGELIEELKTETKNHETALEQKLGEFERSFLDFQKDSKKAIDDNVQKFEQKVGQKITELDNTSQKVSQNTNDAQKRLNDAVTKFNGDLYKQLQEISNAAKNQLEKDIRSTKEQYQNQIQRFVEGTKQEFEQSLNSVLKNLATSVATELYKKLQPNLTPIQQEITSLKTTLQNIAQAQKQQLTQTQIQQIVRQEISNAKNSSMAMQPPTQAGNQTQHTRQ